MLCGRAATLVAALVMAAAAEGIGAEPDRVTLSGHVPAVVSKLAPSGRLPATNTLTLAIGLPLRNQSGLGDLIRQLYDPGSTNYHQYLSPAEFAAAFGPTEMDYEAVVQFAQSNGLSVDATYPNRLVLGVTGAASDIERAFHVTLRTYHHPTEARDFFAPDTEPSVPANLRVIDIEGLNDFVPPRPLSHRVSRSQARPLSFNGSGPNNEYAGPDFRNAYVPGTPLTGAGQTVGLFEFSSYYKLDVTNYEKIIGHIIGYTNYVPLTNVLVGRRSPSTANNLEVALDIEMAIAMAPGLSRVIVYEENYSGTNTPALILNRMATDNLAKQMSSSWTWGNGPTNTVDNVLLEMAAQGQSFFQASGDSDAYTGANQLDNASAAVSPVDSTNLTAVGGTSLTMNTNVTPASWASETVWNYNLNGIPNEGSGGGISSYYTIPWWQENINPADNQVSAAFRNVPDVALTADNVFACYGDGTDNGADYIMGTSCAAPLWAAFTALVNQQSALSGHPPVGFLNPALYAIGAGTNYAACFHDITTGNNIGTNTPGLYNATNGYDLCTGWGTPTGTNLINALAPYPYVVTPPASQTVTNGNDASFSVTAGGQPAFSYAWQFNGTNLSAGSNLSGYQGNVLTITSVTPANAGYYRVVVANNYGAVTSSVATLTVVSPLLFTAEPTNLTVLGGGNAVFSAMVSGATPLAYHWQQNGGNLVNGGAVSGATTNVLTLTAVTTNNAGNYSLVVTNLYGSATSSVASLTVVLPPAISVALTNQTIQCGSNAILSVTASGTSPLAYQWSLDGVALAGATNSSLLLTNVHPPNHMVAVVVTNLYGGSTNSATLAVEDTLPPVITLLGANPLFVELGQPFVDPGATAYDLCAGTAPVTTSGAVNTNAVGTNLVTYTATDGNGNTNTATRTVIVSVTTPPAILWSFTNLTLAAGTNCEAAMPDVTGTNFIIATNLAGGLTISQSPTNDARLPLGSNVVVITVADPYGNTAYSTNNITVQDETPPVITLLGANPFFVELGSAFVDPGATAYDLCAGTVPATASGAVNTNAVGTNLVTYTATDGNGNTNTVARTVIVSVTTPPAILWSFTNLTVAAGTNCEAAMPDVTGTNFIIATNLAGGLTISQSPTNDARLPLGSNVVVITVADPYGNTAYSTNNITVQDETPPVVLVQPQSQTNLIGTTASFNVAAMACTPLTLQWYFTNSALAAQTNGTLTLTNLTPAATGNYLAVATASGGSTTSAVATLTVPLFTTSIAVASSENPSGYRDSVNFTASMIPTNATGTIQFLTNGAAFDLEPLVLGAAVSTNVASLPRATNLITAIYFGDANDYPATNILLQIVTNHPPMAAPAFYSRLAGYPLDIAVADLATNWSDADGDTVSLAAISVSTNGVTVTNLAGTLLYFDANNVNDQFFCTITDSWGGTNFQAVNITIVLTNLPPGIASVSTSNGSVTLTLNGAPGSTYVLQTTTNLLSVNGWTPVTTNLPGTNGVWQFTDTQATNFPIRFYRVMLQQ